MKRILFRTVLVASVAAAMWFLVHPPCVALAMESRSGANLRGIDVSHWDGAIAWPRVAARGVRFAYIKATGGRTVDPRFAINAKNARETGIAAGAYHYAKPTAPFRSGEAAEQATFFVNTVKPVMNEFGDIMPVVDVEQSGGLSSADLARWIRVFVDTVQRQTHRQVMLYTSVDFIERHTDLGGKLSDLPLWVAYYDRFYHGKNPPNIAGWRHWTVWQYSDQGALGGALSAVDLNAGPTSLAALKGDLSPVTQPGTHRSTKPKASATSPVAEAGHGSADKPNAGGNTSPSRTGAPHWVRNVVVAGAVLIALMSSFVVMFTFRLRRKRRSEQRTADSVQESIAQ